MRDAHLSGSCHGAGRSRGRRVGAVLALVIATIGSLLVFVPLVAVAGVAAPGGATPPVGTVDTFPLAPDLTHARALTAGPDGNTWFVSPVNAAIGRITPTGVVTTFTHPELHEPFDIVAGPDGNLWFVDRYVTYDEVSGWTNGWIGRITPAGVITVFRHAEVVQPSSIVAGPDGQLWYTDDWGDGFYTNGTFGSITTSGVITVRGGDDDGWQPAEVVFASDGVAWALGSSGAFGRGVTQLTRYSDLRARTLVPGADGTMWLIGTRSPSSPVEILRLPRGVGVSWVEAFAPSVADPVDLLAGPEGTVWFADATGSVGVISPDGQVTTFPTPGLSPTHLAQGPDGNVWFVDGEVIGRVTPAGTVDQFDVGYAVTSALEPGGDANLWFSGGGASVGRVAATVDGTAVFVQASAGKERATVAWQAPPNPAVPIVGYQVTSVPDGVMCATTDRSCVLSGLTAGTAYTFTVQVVGTNGTVGGPARSNSVVPWSGGTYHAVPTARILDSRLADVGFAGPVTSALPRTLFVAAAPGPSAIPLSASAVVMNVTATDSTDESFLTVYPAGTPMPNASNLNFGAGQVSANLVTVKLGAGGGVDIATAVGETDVVADVVGYYDDGTGPIGGRYVPLTPMRLFDSRVDQDFGGPLTAPYPGYVRVRPPASEEMVPSTAAEAVVNVTVTEADQQSFLLVSGEPLNQFSPLRTSNINFLPGQTVANLAVVEALGPIYLANAVGSVHVIVDLVGYFDAASGARFHAMDPNRVLDTRTGAGSIGKQGGGEVRSLAVAGAPGSAVPAAATGLVANVTVADPDTPGYLAVFPGGAARPQPFSTLNFGVGQVVPNLTSTRLSPSGSLDIYNFVGATHVIADAVGWYGPW